MNVEYWCRYILITICITCAFFFQYLESVRPVLSEERFKEMEKLAVDFKVWEIILEFKDLK